MSENEEPSRSGIRMVVAYDGRAFHGFQKQPGLRTVQGVLNEAIRRLDPAASECRGCSRTDAGVHARGQIVAFDAVRKLPPKGWRMQLNTALPDDVSVRAVETCAVRFDPRFDSTRKFYRYRVHVGESRDPLRDPHSFHVGPARALKRQGRGPETVPGYLDVEAMRRAAAMLVGHHDFRAFRAADDQRENTVRFMYDVRVVTPFAGEEDGLALEFEGNAFMKNMVRILVGTLLDVGRGAMSPEKIPSLLGPTARREDAGPTAPAHGLCLMHVTLGRSELCEAAETT